MNKNLSLIEQAILDEVIKFNKKKYSFIKNHIPYLKVKNRDYTGVGIYIYFEYDKESVLLPLDNCEDTVLSSDKSLEIDVLKYELNYELNITKGKLDVLELVSNDESWNGNYNSFKFKYHE
tara:strand:+ start:4849 stop:5211 length:363 start_codon:yes stop_codon:yes gene_type:complete